MQNIFKERLYLSIPKVSIHLRVYFDDDEDSTVFVDLILDCKDLGEDE